MYLEYIPTEEDLRDYRRETEGPDPEERFSFVIGKCDEVYFEVEEEDLRCTEYERV
jgi:hypothetical protein